MQKWEYEIAPLARFDALTPELGAKRMTKLYGQQGYELVQIIDGLAYFKRLVEAAITISKKDTPYPKGTYFDKDGYVALVIE